MKRALLDVNVLLALLDSDHDGRFVTFDRSLSIASVEGAGEDHLTVL